MAPVSGSMKCPPWASRVSRDWSFSLMGSTGWSGGSCHKIPPRRRPCHAAASGRPARNGCARGGVRRPALRGGPSGEEA